MSLLINNMHTSILFSFFLLIYCVGPNVIETSVARTDLNNSLKVRVNKYCWITLIGLFDVSNVKHSTPPPCYFKCLDFYWKTCWPHGAFQFGTECAILYYHCVMSRVAQQQSLVFCFCEQVRQRIL